MSQPVNATMPASSAMATPAPAPISPPQAQAPGLGLGLGLGLGAKARGGMLWAGASVVLTLALQLGFGAVMARLLDPATFGLMAMAMVTLRLFSYLSQIGLSMTLGAMQRQVMTDDDLRLSLGVVWLASAVSIVAIVLLAPLAAGFFQKPELVPLVRVLAISLLLQALANVSVSLLRRQLRFRALAVVEIMGYTVGYGVVGVLAALAGWGAWALVAASLGQALLTLACAYSVTRHPLVPRWRGAQTGHWQYGARHTAISFSEFMSANVGTALIGRLIGDSALGIFNRSQILAYQPVEKAAGIITRVLFPVVATIQSDRAKVGALFLLAIGVIGVTAAAVSLGLYAAADDVVALLLGSQWMDAVPVVRLLALAVPAIFMSHIAGTLCDAMNLLDFKLKLQLFGMILVVSLMVSLSGFGVSGILWGMLVGEVVRFAAYFLYLAPKLAYRRVAGLGVILVSLATGVSTFLAVTGSLWLAATVQAPLGLRLMAAIVSGILMLCINMIFLASRLAGTDAGRLAANNIPGWRKLEFSLLGGKSSVG